MYVYLAGKKPRNDKESARRLELINNLHGMGISVFDPWGAWTGGAESSPTVALVNLGAASLCDVTVARCSKDATGTALEIGYVLAGGGRAIVWGDVDGAMFHHPNITRVKNEETALLALAWLSQHAQRGGEEGRNSA